MEADQDSQADFERLFDWYREQRQLVDVDEPHVQEILRRRLQTMFAERMRETIETDIEDNASHVGRVNVRVQTNADGSWSFLFV